MKIRVAGQHQQGQCHRPPARPPSAGLPVILGAHPPHRKVTGRAAQAEPLGRAHPGARAQAAALSRTGAAPPASASAPPASSLAASRCWIAHIWA